MKASNFKTWFEQLSQLSRKQQGQVKQRLTQEVQQSAVVKVLEESNPPLLSSL